MRAPPRESRRRGRARVATRRGRRRRARRSPRSSPPSPQSSPRASAAPTPWAPPPLALGRDRRPRPVAARHHAQCCPMVVAIVVDYARITTSSQERRMSKPIIVGYDPATSDRAPVNFGVAAARFTGAPLIVASVGAALDGQDAGQQHEDLVPDATQARDEAERLLEPEGISIECRALTGTSAARALHETSEAEDAGLLVVG